jgi:hypothetical protein
MPKYIKSVLLYSNHLLEIQILIIIVQKNMPQRNTKMDKAFLVLASASSFFN